jgi:hypothetical protein
MWKIIVHPRSVSREIVQDKNIYASLYVVLGFAVILSLLFLISHLKADYPPSPDELDIWIETWGEFAMLPFVKIPAEKYRLAQAIFIIPMMMAVWILMAGTAKILSILFNGKVSYLQYLNLIGFSFFVFWIIGSILDTIYSGLLGECVLNALKLEYGVLPKTLVTYFPSVMWVGVLSLGGIYNAIVIQETERFSFIKSALMGLLTFVWPIVLISTLIR